MLSCVFRIKVTPLCLAAHNEKRLVAEERRSANLEIGISLDVDGECVQSGHAARNPELHTMAPSHFTIKIYNRARP